MKKLAIAKFATSSLLALICIKATIGHTATDTEATLHRYLQGIESISLEINTAKEHRNAIISRMDEIGRELGNLDIQSRDVIDSKPGLTDGINNIEAQIEQLAQKITDTGEALKFIENKLNAAPKPTLLEDLLGRSIEQHRALALKKFQLHKTKSLLNNFVSEKQRLIDSKASLSDSQQSLLRSVQSLADDRLGLVEKRRLLEAQFSSLTSTIVQKQDRQAHLQRRLAEITEDPQKALFTTMQGQLTDPTEGKIQHHFAEPKAQGLLKWEGLVIKAPLGQEINAVFDGTVVFADRMQGLGNVAIVDHGEGYMSLYGMTDFLIVQPGQQVLTGDTIGTIGSGIGNDDSGLYFEVRHNANTLNPADWLEMRRISQDTGS